MTTRMVLERDLVSRGSGLIRPLIDGQTVHLKHMPSTAPTFQIQDGLESSVLYIVFSNVRFNDLVRFT